MKLSDQHGISIITVIVMLGVIMAIIGGLNHKQQLQSKEIKIEHLKTGRSSALFNLRAIASSPESIFVSSKKQGQGNTLLNNCIQGLGCQASGNYQLFTLYASYSASIPALQYSSSTGTDSDGLGKYSMTGAKNNCGAGSSCPFFGVAWFKAECPGGASSCPRAFRLKLRTQINPVSSTDVWNQIMPGFPGSQIMQSTPRNSDFVSNPNFESVDLYVSDILGLGVQICPPHSVMTGLTSNGVITCICNSAFISAGTRADGTNWPICVPLQKCTFPEVLVGIHADGSPYCISSPATRYTCSTVTGNSSASCPSGQKMKGALVADDCTVNASDIVICNNNITITCCKPV